MSFSCLETERLTLRPFADADVDALHALWRLPEVRRFLWDDVVISRDTALEVVAAIRTFGIDPVRTAYRSPWQNPIAERWVGTCRRELLDHVVVFGERHLRRLLADYVAYYNAERVHTRLGDSPEGRPIETRPSPTGRVVGLPRVGGLHHRYVWAEAA